MSEEDLRKLIESSAAETQRRVDAVAEETRRHFDVVAERLEDKIGLLGEGLDAANDRLVRLDTKVERLEDTVEQFRIEVRAEFNDVRSMIKFSHAELDRRIRSLEEGFADLQARVERLESSTH